MQQKNIATISKLSHDGRGIAYINGKTIFLEGALPNETVAFIYSKQKSTFAEGKVNEIISPANTRTTPKCPHFGICGGCALQHMSSKTQLELKQNMLLEQLQHFGNTQPEKILPAITGPIWEYRHKARLGVKYVIKKGKVLVGFREKNARFLADINSCAILHGTVGNKILDLSAIIAKLDSYKHIPQIEIAVGDNVSALIIRHLIDLPNKDQEILTKFAEQNNYYLYLQPKGIDSIHLLYPENTSELLSYTLPKQNIELLFHPTDFTQINPFINHLIVERTLELLAPNDNDQILDLFCGLGNFTLPLAKYCKQIIGVEGSDNMVKRASNNAKHNKLKNAAFYCANLNENIATLPWSKQQFNKILLDPPRTGAIEIIKKIGEFSAKKILYISCNPATLARDSKELINQGYKLEQAGIMDMFPHTTHVESMALFTH